MRYRYPVGRLVIVGREKGGKKLTKRTFASSMFAAKAGAKKVIGVDMSNIIDQAQKIVAANGFADSESGSLEGSRFAAAPADREIPHGSHHADQGQDGRGGPPRRQGRHHHLRVDGLLPPVRVDARLGPVRARPLPRPERAHVPGRGDPVHGRDRRPRVQGGKDWL